jgi:hypothetical protein
LVYCLIIVNMTPEQLEFVSALNNSYTEYVANVANKDLIGSKNLSELKIKVSLLTAFLEIIEDYFEDTTINDDNFFTIQEIQDCIQHFNNICGTVHYIDLN